MISGLKPVEFVFFYSLNAAVMGIFRVVEFWGKVAKPPQNGAKQKMSD
jgi:hypothetical protein